MNNADLCFSITTDAAGSAEPVQFGGGETRATVSQQLYAARAAGLGAGTHAGVTVNSESALRLAAVYSSIRIIAETIGSLPVQVFERNADGTTGQTTAHWSADLLGVQPNRDQTPMVFSETAMQHVLGHGNSFAAIDWSGRRGEAVALENYHPTEVQVERDRMTGGLIYRTSRGGESRTYDASEMLHVPGFGTGILGFSPIRYFAQAIGLGLAQERFASLYFAGGVKPNLIIEHPGEIGDNIEGLRQQIEQGFSGDKAFGALLLEGGVTAKAISIPANEAQLLESRNFNGRDISQRMFRIPPHISGYTDALKYDHVEQADLQFLKHCLTPWLIRREQELLRKLYTRADRERFFLKHNLDSLLRADLKTRYESYQTGILSGFLKINEARALENRPPEPEGERLILAESVFGSQDEPAPDAARSQRGSEPVDFQPAPETDPRLRAMLLQQLEGLFNREVAFAERHAGKSDWPARLTEFYTRHRELVAERLAPLAVDLAPVLAGIDLRASELADPATRVEVFERHSDCLEPLADELLDTNTKDTENE